MEYYTLIKNKKSVTLEMLKAEKCETKFILDVKLTIIYFSLPHILDFVSRTTLLIVLHDYWAFDEIRLFIQINV